MPAFPRTKDPASEPSNSEASHLERSIGFHDRADAGRKLAVELRHYASQRPIVVALPRGGVAVGYEIARALDAPLDICVVRKIGVPWQPELGVGAVAEDGFVYVNRPLVEHVGLSHHVLEATTEAQRREVERRVQKFRGEKPRPTLQGRCVLLVDDGIATGGTTRAAIRSIRAQKPSLLVLAVPVASADTIRALEPEVDRVISLLAPTNLTAVGEWYQDFRQVTDAEVVHVLERAADGT